MSFAHHLERVWKRWKHVTVIFAKFLLLKAYEEDNRHLGNTCLYDQQKLNLSEESIKVYFA